MKISGKNVEEQGFTLQKSGHDSIKQILNLINGYK